MYFLKACLWLERGHDSLGLGWLLAALGLLLRPFGTMLRALELDPEAQGAAGLRCERSHISCMVMGFDGSHRCSHLSVYSD